MILNDILIQYKNYIYLEDDVEYSQLTISNSGIVSHRDIKLGVEIGRKRQFVVDLKNHPNTLIFTRQGIINGSVGLIPQELNSYIVTENMPMFSVDVNLVLPEYLVMFLNSKMYKEQLVKMIPSGTAQKALHEDKWLQIQINLPTIIEQEKQVLTFNLHKIQETIVTNEIAKQEIYINSLRQSILQQAIEGKLVAQNSSDEPASVLLEKIKAEKEQLIKEKKIKKQKDLPTIKDEEKPFELPQGWEWCRLGEISKYITDGKHGDCQNATNSRYYFISAKDIVNGEISYKGAREITKSDFDEVHKRTDLKAFDILLPNTGASIGKIAITPYDSRNEQTTFQKSVAIIKYNYNLVIPRYLATAIHKEVEKIKTKLQGTAMVNLLLSQTREFIIPLPPLAEQQRIVEKVDSLMALCDELEQEVKTAKKYASQLMEAVLQEAFTEPHTKADVVEFDTLKTTKANLTELTWKGAARDNISKDTWEEVMKDADDLFNEGN